MVVKKFDTLQCFRGLAALGVVLHHAAISTEYFVQNIPGWCNGFFARGFLGVDFFFVLSGFIIFNSHFNDMKSHSALMRYCRKRFLRIFPPYWPVSIALIALYYSFPGISAGNRGGNFSLVSSLFLLPDTYTPALMPAWTLIHEVLFYAIFATCFVSNVVFFVFVFAWVLAIAIFFLLGPMELSPFLRLFIAPINIEFIAGMGMAYLSKTISSNRYGIPIIIFGVGSCVLLSLMPVNVQNRILFAIPFSALVLGAALLESEKSFSLPRWMVALGDTSYSIYLVNYPLLSATSKLLGHMPFFMSWWLSMLIGVVSSLCAGVFYHQFVEKPSMLAFRRLFEGYTVRIA